MRRAEKKKVDVNGIFTSDWHLREQLDMPICRTDDFWKAQWDKVDQVAALQRKYKCVVFHAGDLYHRWKPSPHLLSETMRHIPENFITVYGQHDLPQHNMELRYKSGINALDTAGLIKAHINGSWGHEPLEYMYPGTERLIGIWHKFVWDGERLPWPGCDEMTAKEVLKAYPEFDVIVTGDHHKPFVYSYRNKKGRVRRLVNCGCLTRQDASYAEHKPCVWLYDAESNDVIPHYLTIEENVVSREHIDVQKKRDDRIDAFVSKLDSDFEVDISFEKNLERFIRSNKISKKVSDVIYKSID